MVFQQAQSGGQLRGVFQYLVDFGFLDFILPFILIFVLIFAILQMVQLFKVQKKKPDGSPVTKAVRNARGEETQVPVFVGDRKINALIGLAIALMLTIPHAAGMYPANMDPISLISSFLPSTIVVLAAMFVILLLLGFAGASEKSALQLVIAMIGVGLLVFLFALNIFPTFFPQSFYWLTDPTIQALLFVLLIMGLVVYWVMKPAPTPLPAGAPGSLRSWMLEQHPRRP